MSNVRFYRLGTLPSFDSTKHQGIFVHATGTTAGSDTYLMETGVTFNQWLINNHYTEIPSGLWFGGENGWELLSNDTTSGKIDAAIDAKIQELDVSGYAQATMDTNVVVGDKTDSKLTILGIQEVDGEISNDSSKDVNIAIDGVYNETTNKIATKSTVTNAIEALDSEGTIQAVTTAPAQGNTANTVLTFKGVKEENGKILQGDGASTFTVGDAKLKIQIGSKESGAFEVFSANAQSNGAIKLNENVFKKDENNVISVITKNNDVSSTNPLVTQKDIDSLAGAMHYKGSVSSLADFEKIINNTDSDSDAEEAGNVYIATGDFTHGDNDISTGDMIVFNGPNNYNVIQSNLTLGTGAGQVAANTEGLTNGNLVVATDKGIKTIGISASVLEETNNTRNLTYGTISGKGITITDSLKIMNRNFDKSINIVSENDSIQITVEKDEQADKGVKLDLVWNTTIE